MAVLKLRHGSGGHWAWEFQSRWWNLNVNVKWMCTDMSCWIVIVNINGGSHGWRENLFDLWLGCLTVNAFFQFHEKWVKRRTLRCFLHALMRITLLRSSGSSSHLVIYHIFFMVFLLQFSLFSRQVKVPNLDHPRRLFQVWNQQDQCWYWSYLVCLQPQEVSQV